MNNRLKQDLDALASTRDRLNDADNRADADAFARELADDIVIMPPFAPQIAGRDECVRFVREAFREYPTRRYTATVDEIRIEGDLAVERGSYEQMTEDPATGKPSYEHGRGIWMWTRTPDGWKAWRFIWHVDENDEWNAPAVGADALPAVEYRAGHFLLESGYHSGAWFDLDRLLLQPAAARAIARALADRLRRYNLDGVCGPLSGGAFLGYALATELATRFYCAEPARVDPGAGLFRAEYQLTAAAARAVNGQRVAVVDDAVSAGSSVRATLAALEAHGACTVVVGTPLLLGTVARDYFAARGVPVEALRSQPLEMWPPADCPLCRSSVPLTWGAPD